MKRPRSYDEDPSANLKEWDRHHRRFHEEDWDSSRSSRSSRRFDHGSFDRYTTPSSSPQSSGWGCGGGGGERFHGSESFSALRRGFPKGFRSERSGRDRFRRERSESTWQLQRRSEEIGDRKVGNSRSVDSSSNGEVDKEVVKRVTREEEKVVNRESCSNSEMEMEEGELEPDHDAAVEAPIATVGVGADCEKEITNSRLETEEVENCKGREESESEKELEVNERKEEGEVKLNEVKEEVRGDGAGAAIILEEKRENGEGVMKDHGEGFETKGGDDVGDGEKKEARRGLDLEAEPEGVVSENDKQSNVILELMSDRPQESCKDKGKLSTAILDSNKEDYVDKWDNREGPSSGRGFELVFPSVLRPSSGGIVVEKQKDDDAKLETLDLSLGLSGGLPKPTSPSRVTSFQSFPSSFRTMSDGFTNSISFSGSQTFVHNPSCSLTQNSLDNFEQSVGSRPLFGGVDQVANGSTIWQAQTSNEPKSKGGGGLLFQRILMNSNYPSHTSLQAQNFQQSPNPNNLSRQSSLPRQLSPAQSQGSRDTKSEHKDKRLLTSERSSNSIFRSEQHDGDQLVLNGGGFERIITKIISEPIQVVGRIFQDMTDKSIAYLKESISEMISNAEKHGKMNLLQEVLQRRTDLTMETMSKCHRNLLEILVALKTGLIDFLRRGPNIVPSSYMVDVFFNLKCRNIACRTVLPVDDCECKVCARNSGFCSACMCLVCSKFDTASNTCGWVGCDLCLHWCHTDCGLRETYIRNGPTPKANGLTEMQFHCVACDHPSEMFGFVKDVFKQCAKSWKAETLAKELQYVRRIFSASNDVKGKKLCGIADRMMGKLQGNAKVAEIINYIMGFFSESESNTSNGPSILPTTEPSRNNVEVSNGVAQPIKEATWLPPSSYYSEKTPVLEKACVLPNTHCDAIQVGRLTRDTEIPSVPEKNSVVDELESVVKFKQAEAKMYQDHADSARKEAEGLKRVAVAKNVQIEEEYNTQIARLRLIEAEERRKQKLEQLQAIERSHCEFFNMKMKMESEIKDMLLKMEGTKHNFSS